MYIKHVSPAEEPQEGNVEDSESITMTHENTPIGEILTSKVTFSRFYMYLTLRAVNIFIDIFRLKGHKRMGKTCAHNFLFF